MSDNSLPHRGHVDRPFDELIHAGHMVKLLAPNHPVHYVTKKGGHSYHSQNEPDPTNPTPGATRLVAWVWPWDIPELLSADPPYQYLPPDEPTPVVAPVEDVPSEAKGKSTS